MRQLDFRFPKTPNYFAHIIVKCILRHLIEDALTERVDTYQHRKSYQERYQYCNTDLDPEKISKKLQGRPITLEFLGEITYLLDRALKSHRSVFVPLSKKYSDKPKSGELELKKHTTVWVNQIYRFIGNMYITRKFG